MLLKKDLYVKNPKKEDWGVGKVIENISGNIFNIFFINVGFKKFDKRNNPLVETSEVIENDIFLNLTDEHNDMFTTISELEKHFLQNYENGFNGKKYKDRERIYKDEAHNLAIELLGQNKFKELLDTEQYQEISLRALKIINKTNLIFPNEKMSFKDGLKEDLKIKQFSNLLFELLYSSEKEQLNFEKWITFLESIEANKWTIASYFQFLIHPNKYIFIKPTITQEIAKISAYDIKYTPKLNWNTFNKVQKFSKYFKNNIQSLNPKDMIDVQSFMWCVSERNK